MLRQPRTNAGRHNTNASGGKNASQMIIGTNSKDSICQIDAVGAAAGGREYAKTNAPPGLLVPTSGGAFEDSRENNSEF